MCPPGQWAPGPPATACTPHLCPHTPKWHTSTVPTGKAKLCHGLELALPCPPAPSWPGGAPASPGVPGLPGSGGWHIPAPLMRLWDRGHWVPANSSDDSTGARDGGGAPPVLACLWLQGCAKGTPALADRPGTAPGWCQSWGHLQEGSGPCRGAWGRQGAHSPSASAPGRQHGKGRGCHAGTAWGPRRQ